MFEDFKKFISRGNVMDLAVGVVVGSSFSKIVSSLVNDIIMPPLGFIIEGIDFNKMELSLPIRPGCKVVAIRYGSFATTVIDFLLIAFAIFCLVKLINKIKKVNELESCEKKCPECDLFIPRAAKRCGHCTSVLI